jgi:hypothetical protein
MNQNCDFTPVAHLNRLFKNFTFDQGPQKYSSDSEVVFTPPWETKIGQLQQVVRSLHQDANVYLKNRYAFLID